MEAICFVADPAPKTRQEHGHQRPTFGCLRVTWQRCGLDEYANGTVFRNAAKMGAIFG